MTGRSRRSSVREIETILESLEADGGADAIDSPSAWADAVVEAVAADDDAWRWAYTVNADPADDPEQVVIRRPAPGGRLALSVPRESIPDRFDPDDFPVR